MDGQVADQARGASGGQVDSGRLGLTEEGRRITAVGGAISATRGGGTRAIRRSVVDPLRLRGADAVLIVVAVALACLPLWEGLP